MKYRLFTGSLLLLGSLLAASCDSGLAPTPEPTSVPTALIAPTVEPTFTMAPLPTATATLLPKGEAPSYTEIQDAYEKRASSVKWDAYVDELKGMTITNTPVMVYDVISQGSEDAKEYFIQIDMNGISTDVYPDGLLRVEKEAALKYVGGQWIVIDAVIEDVDCSNGHCLVTANNVVVR